MASGDAQPQAMDEGMPADELRRSRILAQTVDANMEFARLTAHAVADSGAFAPTEQDQQSGGVAGAGTGAAAAAPAAPAADEGVVREMDQPPAAEPVDLNLDIEMVPLLPPIPLRRRAPLTCERMWNALGESEPQLGGCGTAAAPTTADYGRLQPSLEPLHADALVPFDVDTSGYVETIDVLLRIPLFRRLFDAHMLHPFDFFDRSAASMGYIMSWAAQNRFSMTPPMQMWYRLQVDCMYFGMHDALRAVQSIMRRAFTGSTVNAKEMISEHDLAIAAREHNAAIGVMALEAPVIAAMRTALPAYTQRGASAESVWSLWRSNIPENAAFELARMVWRHTCAATGLAPDSPQFAAGIPMRDVWFNYMDNMSTYIYARIRVGLPQKDGSILVPFGAAVTVATAWTAPDGDPARFEITEAYCLALCHWLGDMRGRCTDSAIDGAGGLPPGPELLAQRERVAAEHDSRVARAIYAESHAPATYRGGGQDAGGDYCHAAHGTAGTRIMLRLALGRSYATTVETLCSVPGYFADTLPNLHPTQNCSVFISGSPLPYFDVALEFLRRSAICLLGVDLHYLYQTAKLLRLEPLMDLVRARSANDRDIYEGAVQAIKSLRLTTEKPANDGTTAAARELLGAGAGAAEPPQPLPADEVEPAVGRADRMASAGTVAMGGGHRGKRAGIRR